MMKLNLNCNTNPWMIIKKNNEEVPRKEIIRDVFSGLPDIYSINDFEIFYQYFPSSAVSLSSLDELLERDIQRENDGFPRKIKIGPLVKPTPGKGTKVIVVPATTEEKFYHDPRIMKKQTGEGGSGSEEEGEVIGEIPIRGENAGTGAGQGGGEGHDMTSNAYEIGKILTEKFLLPNLKEKGKKRSLTKFKYDLTDRNEKTGQVLDKRETLKKIIETNIILGRVSKNSPINSRDLLIDRNDMIYQILSRERDFESEAVVFFLRDYSGSMSGMPTEIVVQQHLLIYSWLLYQYQNRVETRFILHDDEAKEVPDFYTYYNSQIAGGTLVSSAYHLVNEIVQKENLARNYNIYIFHGTDGDDWMTDDEYEKISKETEGILSYTNRFGITIISHGEETSLETSIKKTGLLEKNPSLIRLDSFSEEEATDDRIIEGIKKLIS